MLKAIKLGILVLALTLMTFSEAFAQRGRGGGGSGMRGGGGGGGGASMRGGFSGGAPSGMRGGGGSSMRSGFSGSPGASMRSGGAPSGMRGGAGISGGSGFSGRGTPSISPRSSAPRGGITTSPQITGRGAAPRSSGAITSPQITGRGGAPRSGAITSPQITGRGAAGAQRGLTTTPQFNRGGAGRGSLTTPDVATRGMATPGSRGAVDVRTRSMDWSQRAAGARAGLDTSAGAGARAGGWSQRDGARSGIDFSQRGAARAGVDAAQRGEIRGGGTWSQRDTAARARGDISGRTGPRTGADLAPRAGDVRSGGDWRGRADARGPGDVGQRADARGGRDWSGRTGDWSRDRAGELTRGRTGDWTRGRTGDWGQGGRGDWSQWRGGRPGGDWSHLASFRGDKHHWGGRQFNRHHHWHRGFSVNLFVGRPWGWSPWWGGWGPSWGFGRPFGWGVGGFGLGGWGLGGWGWNDWWGPWGYAPLAFRTGYWGYYNPYCSAPLTLGTTVIDYSQPIVLAREAVPGVESLDEEDPATAMAMAEFDAAREAFLRGNYAEALARAHEALEHLPTDAVLHEFVSLVHFAQGNYRDAAGTIHAVLAVGPGWNWETLRSLYPNVATYTEQLRALEAYRRAQPEAAYARFLLAYHYMTLGHGEAAAKELREVVALEPGDTVAAQLLAGLTGEEVATPAAEGAAPPAEAIEAQATPPEAEWLIGSWKATRDDGSSFALVMDAEGRFTWTFTQRDQTTELSGSFTLADSLLVLESEEGGAMIGRVNQTGDDQLHFRLVGAPETDPGLMFER